MNVSLSRATSVSPYTRIGRPEHYWKPDAKLLLQKHFHPVHRKRHSVRPIQRAPASALTSRKYDFDSFDHGNEYYYQHFRVHSMTNAQAARFLHPNRHIKDAVLSLFFLLAYTKLSRTHGAESRGSIELGIILSSAVALRIATITLYDLSCNTREPSLTRSSEWARVNYNYV